ncbi:MAG: hypothetical protein GFH27_549325n83 [Chloroflexi bacterium AL-W]|nr:hypothetical protein [Chloroflexi bacterium AL-N1]NOK70067.1 hypothetical protein [Chloroflexi bacterium AL-N10]NOK77921.1 hypothetical protein [Chloroflexi bacterium AL-N5]NOK84930.1 hypothetical protein [Chloroflexi bacterium AL-W]NOK91909.1 hypothetical protein [Chloroflexi bacterium AL-N15]
MARPRRSFLKRMTAAGSAFAATLTGIFPEMSAAKSTGTTDINWRPLTDAEAIRVTKQALNSKDGQQLAEYLLAKGFTLNQTETDGITVQQNGQKGHLIRIAFSNTDGQKGVLFQATGKYADGQATTALAIYSNRPDSSLQVDVWEVVNDDIMSTESLTIEQNTLHFTNLRNGETRVLTLPHSQPTSADYSPKSSDTDEIAPTAVGAGVACNTCLQVFDFLYGLGCTFSGAIVCLACGGTPIAVACGILCALFWYLVCYTGTVNNRCFFCQTAGSCTTC